jgi:hypothetical protein
MGGAFVGELLATAFGDSGFVAVAGVFDGVATFSNALFFSGVEVVESWACPQVAVAEMRQRRSQQSRRGEVAGISSMLLEECIFVHVVCIAG